MSNMLWRVGIRISYSYEKFFLCKIWISLEDLLLLPSLKPLFFNRFPIYHCLRSIIIVAAIGSSTDTCHFHHYPAMFFTTDSSAESKTSFILSLIPLMPAPP